MDARSKELDEKKNCVVIGMYTLYEYLSVYSGIYPENRGIAIREIQQGKEGRKERFDVLMEKFKVLAESLNLDKADKSTYELIKYSYDENGISEQLLADTKLALMTNPKIIAELKKTDIGNILLSAIPTPKSCGSETF